MGFNRRFLVLAIILILAASSFSNILKFTNAPASSIEWKKSEIKKYPILYLDASTDTENKPIEINAISFFDFSLKGISVRIEELTITEDTYMPNTEGNVSFTVVNKGDSALNLSMIIFTPYFVTIKDNVIYYEREEGTGTYTWSFGVPIELGELAGGKNINITFTLVGIVGKDAEGSLVINILNVDENEVVDSESVTLHARPAFSFTANFEPFLLNISKTNKSNLTIYIQNDAPYDIYNLTIEIKEVSEGLQLEKTSEVIEKLEVGSNTTIRILATVTDMGVYQAAVTIISDNGGYDITRVTLLAVTKKVIIFDEGHNQYYRFTSEGMSDLIELASTIAPVIISRGDLTGDLFDPSITQIIILPNPEPPDETAPVLSDEEIETLQYFVENGGSLLLMGNWYRYFWPDNPGGFNDLTKKYGIYWYDGDVYDTVSYSGAYYHVVAKNFADNDVAKIISVGVEEVHFSGTALKLISPEVPTELYPILIGNENYTFLTLGTVDDPKIAEGPDVIMMVAAIVKGVGKIFASGSVYAFSSYYYFTDNEPLIKNILTWLAGIQKLDIEVEGIPYTIKVGEEIHAQVTIINRGVTEIRNIVVSLEFSQGMINKNGTNTYSIPLLKPGESVKIKWILYANKEGDYMITISASAEGYPETITKRFVVRYEKVAAPVPYHYIALAAGIIIIAVIIVALKVLKKK